MDKSVPSTNASSYSLHAINGADGPRYDVDVPIDKVDFHPQKMASGTTSRYETLTYVIIDLFYFRQPLFVLHNSKIR